MNDTESITQPNLHSALSVSESLTQNKDEHRPENVQSLAELSSATDALTIQAHSSSSSPTTSSHSQSLAHSETTQSHITSQANLPYQEEIDRRKEVEHEPEKKEYRENEEKYYSSSEDRRARTKKKKEKRKTKKEKRRERSDSRSRSRDKIRKRDRGDSRERSRETQKENKRKEKNNKEKEKEKNREKKRLRSSDPGDSFGSKYDKEYADGAQPEPSNKLFVANCDYKCTLMDITSLFTACTGFEEFFFLKYDRGAHCGFGFAKFATIENAEAAKLRFNGYKLKGRELAIRTAENADKVIPLNDKSYSKRQRSSSDSHEYKKTAKKEKDEEKEKKAEKEKSVDDYIKAEETSDRDESRLPKEIPKEATIKDSNLNAIQSSKDKETKTPNKESILGGLLPLPSPLPSSSSLPLPAPVRPMQYIYSSYPYHTPTHYLSPSLLNSQYPPQFASPQLRVPTHNPPFPVPVPGTDSGVLGHTHPPTTSPVLLPVDSPYSTASPSIYPHVHQQMHAMYPHMVSHLFPRGADPKKNNTHTNTSTCTTCTSASAQPTITPYSPHTPPSPTESPKPSEPLSGLLPDPCHPPINPSLLSNAPAHILSSTTPYHPPLSYKHQVPSSSAHKPSSTSTPTPKQVHQRNEHEESLVLEPTRVALNNSLNLDAPSSLPVPAVTKSSALKGSGPQPSLYYTPSAHFPSYASSLSPISIAEYSPPYECASPEPYPPVPASLPSRPLTPDNQEPPTALELRIHRILREQEARHAAAYQDLEQKMGQIRHVVENTSQTGTGLQASLMETQIAPYTGAFAAIEALANYNKTGSLSQDVVGSSSFRANSALYSYLKVLASRQVNSIWNGTLSKDGNKVCALQGFALSDSGPNPLDLPKVLDINFTARLGSWKKSCLESTNIIVAPARMQDLRKVQSLIDYLKKKDAAGAIVSASSRIYLFTPDAEFPLLGSMVPSADYENMCAFFVSVKI